MIENIRMSFQSIWAQKLRSVITMLGVIIGIASIIAIFSIIEGETENMRKSLTGGKNNTMQIEYSPSSKFEQAEKKTSKKEKKPDYIPIFSQNQLEQVERLPGVKKIEVTYVNWLPIFHQENYIDSEVIAITQNFFKMENYQLLEGRMFTKNDYQNEKQVTLLNKIIYDELFPKGNGVGKMVEMKGTPFKIIGVVQENEAEESFGTPSKSFVPKRQYAAISENFNPTPAVLVQGKTASTLQETTKQVIRKLNTFVPKSDYVFGVNNFSDFEKSMTEINQSKLRLLGGIASISLLVGGIGVMNIMLVSVTERTREIGVKKALGARRRIILLQFLTEAIVLTVTGGIFGIVLGIIVGRAYNLSMGYPPVISKFAILGSLFFSLIIGIIFGIMPAIKASKLNPIEALRYE